MLDDPTKTVKSIGASSYSRGEHPNTVESLKPHRWKKGQSGNPNGRPKKVEAARDKALDQAEAVINFHKGVLEDPNASILEKQRSAQFLWENGVGKPPQAVDITTTNTHNLANDFEMIVRALNDRTNKPLQDLQRQKALEIEVDFSDLDRFLAGDK